MFTLVERQDAIYLREYCTYDRPDYTQVCSLWLLGIKSLKELPVKVVSINQVIELDLKNKITVIPPANKNAEYLNSLSRLFKFSIENSMHFYIRLDYGFFNIYGSDENLTFLKLQGDIL